MNVGYCGMKRRKSRLRHVIAAPACRYFSKSRIYRIYQIAVRGKPAIGDGVLWTTLCKRGEAERSLETAAAGAVSLGGSVVASHHRSGHATLDTHDAPLFCVRRSFFSAKPTFCSLSSYPSHHSATLQTSPNQAAAIKNSRK